MKKERDLLFSEYNYQRSRAEQAENEIFKLQSKLESLEKNPKIIEKIVEDQTQIDQLASEVKKLMDELAAKDRQLDFYTKVSSIEDQLTPQVDNFNPFTEKGTASFGTAWPLNPAKGDLFLKVDSKPNRLYKWNGRKWIEIDRQRINDTLAYDANYIDWLIDQVRRGLKDYEELSEIEKSQIVTRIKQRGNNAS